MQVSFIMKLLLVLFNKSHMSNKLYLSYKRSLVYYGMERVPTWAKSPYLGMFQYKNAGPKRIHHKATPLLLPASPYLGSFRHDVLLMQAFVVLSVSKSLEDVKVSVGTQTDVAARDVSSQADMCMCDVSSQTDMCLTAYVMDGYP